MVGVVVLVGIVEGSADDGWISGRAHETLAGLAGGLRCHMAVPNSRHPRPQE